MPYKGETGLGPLRSTWTRSGAWHPMTSRASTVAGLRVFEIAPPTVYLATRAAAPADAFMMRRLIVCVSPMEGGPIMATASRERLPTTPQRLLRSVAPGSPAKSRICRTPASQKPRPLVRAREWSPRAALLRGVKDQDFRLGHGLLREPGSGARGFGMTRGALATSSWMALSPGMPSPQRTPPCREEGVELVRRAG